VTIRGADVQAEKAGDRRCGDWHSWHGTDTAGSGVLVKTRRQARDPKGSVPGGRPAAIGPDADGLGARRLWILRPAHRRGACVEPVLRVLLAGRTAAALLPRSTR